jgi:hypothetical protein
MDADNVRADEVGMLNGVVGAVSRLLLLVAPLLAAAALAVQADSVDRLAERFAREVSLRLQLPAAEQRTYGRMLEEALAAAQVHDLRSQYVLVVDRSPAVQAAMLYFLDAGAAPRFVGATRASTGKPGSFEHFYTPLGVFAHTPDHMDYRAEGTRNELGVRGYGVKGMRVYDFGWVDADRGWGPPARSPMRLQVHATDPALERYLGRVRSKGCIRIPASLNVFLDRYGILDADYLAQADAGAEMWVLRPDREPVAGAGRYLVVLDSGRTRRPAWSP